MSREPENRAAFGDDDEGALVQEVGVDVADGSAGELQGKFAIASREIIS